MIDISAADLRMALEAMAATSAILKRRFPNMTVNETNVLAKEIVYAIKSVTEQGG